MPWRPWRLGGSKVFALRGEPTQIKEIKRHLNKPTETYLCDLLRRGPGHLALLYVSDRPGRIGDVIFEPGCRTYAHYWEGRGYVLWRMYAPDGRLKGYAFHLCKDVRIGEDFVEYLDLLLDLWVHPDGQVVTLDQEELDTCTAAGKIGPEEARWIERHREAISATWADIVQEAAENSRQ